MTPHVVKPNICIAQIERKYLRSKEDALQQLQSNIESGIYVVLDANKRKVLGMYRVIVPDEPPPPTVEEITKL